MPIRDEAINVFMGLPGEDPRLELTYNHGVDSYDLGTATTTSRSGSTTSERTLEGLAADGIDPEKPPYPVREGGPRICFVRDPDGYRIELIESSLDRPAALGACHRCSRRRGRAPRRTRNLPGRPSGYPTLR